MKKVNSKTKPTPAYLVLPSKDVKIFKLILLAMLAIIVLMVVLGS
jgi:hypothetical protein